MKTNRALSRTTAFGGSTNSAPPVAGRIAAVLSAVAALVAFQLANSVPAVAGSDDGTVKGRTDVARGPAGTDFYYPPDSLVDGPHGSVIWARKLAGEAALPAAENWKVLYRSRTPHGEPVAVSGTVAVPKGEPPEGGWPVMSWAHGSVGVADSCAPSRDSASHPDHYYIALMNETLSKWIDRGYAVTKTDYQGLGTDGMHSYLIGAAEARAAADITLAANRLSANLSSEWVVNGHSQGAMAGLFTGELGQAWAPELDLRGAVALAPGANYSTLFKASRHLPFEGAALTALLIRGVETAIDLETQQILTPKARDMLSHTNDRCLPRLRAADSWGGMNSDEVFRDNADMSDFDRVVAENDPKHLSPDVPVFLAQGGQDGTAPATGGGLCAQYGTRGTDIECHLYPTADHRGVVAASYADVGAWVDQRVGHH